MITSVLARRRSTRIDHAAGDPHLVPGLKDYSCYRRELDISRAVQTVKYESGGVTYSREYIASYPDQVMAFRFTAHKPGALSGDIWLDSMHCSEIAAEQGHSKEDMEAIITKAEGKTLTLSGESKDLFWLPQIVKLSWDLFNNTIEATKALGTDEDLRKELTEKRDRLLGPKVGRWGQVKGMRIRGGFELDMQWDDGKFVQAEVLKLSSSDDNFRVLYKGVTKDFKFERGQSLELTAAMLSK